MFNNTFKYYAHASFNSYVTQAKHIVRASNQAMYAHALHATCMLHFMAATLALNLQWYNTINNNIYPPFAF